MTARYVRVQGKCPHGCGDTLEVNLHNRRHSCSNAACPDRHAVQAILDHDETSHIVRIDEHGWTAKHPILERVEDRLFDCEVGKGLALFEGPPAWIEPGDYEVTVNDDGTWNWRKIDH